MIPLNSIDLSKKISSSNTINSFIKFLQKALLNDKLEIVFIVFDPTVGHFADNLLASVYWKLEESSYISLSGNVVSTQANENNLGLKGRVLEETSASNLVMLFENISSNDSDNEPLKNMIESLMRLAQVNLRGKGAIYEIYFQSSVIINEQKEYPLYILKSQETELQTLIKELTKDGQIEEKVKLIQELPSEAYDSFIFSNSEIYKSLRQVSKEREVEFSKILKEMKRERGNFLQSAEMTLEDFERIKFDELQRILKEMIDERVPKLKLEKLAQIHSNLAKNSSFTLNADILLPLLTSVLIEIQGPDGEEANILGEVEFIERFGRENDLSGLNGYILTSTNAAIEIIKTEGQAQATQPTMATPPVSQAQTTFSSIMSSIASIGQVPKVIATSISSTLTRSPRSHGDDPALTSFRERMLATNSPNDLMIRDPKQVTDIKEFLELVSRKDTRSVVVKKNPENVKFKARTSRYLVTLVVKDSAKAEKLIKMLPTSVQPTIIN